MWRPMQKTKMHFLKILHLLLASFLNLVWISLPPSPLSKWDAAGAPATSIVFSVQAFKPPLLTDGSVTTEVMKWIEYNCIS
mmetsp:Transcript_7652/g.11349  ORF Transcript_7652/g.11349 Transcript_7652/m.11349 type:complete len:81 (+) Transcript_7652:984-1226(+)